MDNKNEFITKLKEILKKYDISKSYNSPEAITDEIINDLEGIINNYRTRERFEKNRYQEIIDEVIGALIEESQNSNNSIFDTNKSTNNTIFGKILSGPILREGETTLDKRITRIKNVYEIYQDNITKEKLMILRFRDNKNITIRIMPDSKQVINYFYSNNIMAEKKAVEPFLEIDYLSEINREETIFSDRIIKEIVKKPILEKGEIACNGRLQRDECNEVYYDRKTKQSLKVTRMGNQVLLECKNEFDRIFISGEEITKENYIDKVINNLIPNIFINHYGDIQEDTLNHPYIIDWIVIHQPLEVGEKTVSGRIYRLNSEKEKYIDMITAEILEIERSIYGEDEYVTAIIGDNTFHYKNGEQEEQDEQEEQENKQSKSLFHTLLGHSS